MPMIKERLGDVLTGYTVDYALEDGVTGITSPYIAIGHLFFESIDAFQKEYLPQREEVRKDIPNFTDIQSIVQISEVIC